MAFAELGDPERAWDLRSLIHPLSHGMIASATTSYKVEP